MNRRGFLKLLCLAATGAALAPVLELDPERLLWVPGAKTFFLPSEPVLWNVHAPQFLLTPDWVTREALMVLKSNLNIVGQINRSYDDGFSRLLIGSATIGSTVNVKRPARYVVADEVGLRHGEDFLTIRRAT